VGRENKIILNSCRVHSLSYCFNNPQQKENTMGYNVKKNVFEHVNGKCTNATGNGVLPQVTVSIPVKDSADIQVTGMWSGGKRIPKIMERVKLNFNNLGAGVVVAHYYENGYVGVQVLLDSPPAWRNEQCKRTYGIKNPPAIAFGAEIERIEE